MTISLWAYRILVLASGFASLLLATIVLAQWFGPHDPADVLLLQDTQSNVPQELDRTIAVPAFSVARDRPLFRSDRKPFQAPEPPPVEQVVEPPPEVPLIEPPVEAASQPAPEPPPEGSLRGVILTNSLGLALLEIPTGNPAGWFPVGHKIGGWTLTEISEDEVIFKSGEAKQTIKLYVDNPISPVANPG
jgi:hypothetical protein